MMNMGWNENEKKLSGEWENEKKKKNNNKKSWYTHFI